MKLPDFIPFDPNELLLGYQKRWIADESQLKIAEKSRRTGLTWAEAADDVLIASRNKSDGGSDVFYIGSNKEMAREFIDACAMWASKFNRASGQIQEELFEDEDKDILTYVIYFASGFKIKALSSNPKNLRGMQVVVCIDEAAFHEKLAEVLKAALALTMWGAKVRLISTHNGVDNLFNQLIQDSRAGRKSYSIHTITLDDACREGLYQRICQVSKRPWSAELEEEWKSGLLRETATEEDALEEYYCVPKRSSGGYLPRPLVDRAADRNKVILRFECDARFMEWTEEEREILTLEWLLNEVLPELESLNKDYRHSFGVDFARSGDLSVFAVVATLPNTARNVEITLEIRNCPYNQQRQIMLFVLSKLPRFIGAAFDATGNGGYLAEAALIRYGSSMVETVQLNDKWYREWMPKYKALYESDLIRIPQNEEIILDQGHIVVINGVPKIDKNRTQGKSGKRHGDSAVAYCMAVRASYMTGGEIDFIPLPAKHSDDNKDDDSIFRSEWDY
ncbi:terminase large subunit domain-containing protein [Pasteurella multocida]|uniref:terminase large subunit domain-containing protein n=1 Tax=Pasteurella multocida TaxID=747 RepID=UPI00064C78E0|nr:terminase family protein [Pasteurella multocida]KLT57342.1 Mu-like prophage FluMu protein gp28 [Pasteurella multocida subsp. multocida]HDR0871247.1 terminase family protein [Pasteurella multocida]HDR0874393.1 terminase family protein [Pasteurella multocida]